MPSSTPHQKFYFYHLPTRGRAGIKLGDAWYVSNVSIIFYCSMLLYLLFWTILGFIFHFYIIFGTNLLTGGPVQIAVFCLFQCFAEKEYQMESKWNETFGNVILSTNMIQETWSGRQETTEEATRQGVRLPPWARPAPSWAPCCSTDVLLPPIYTYVPLNHQTRSQNPISTAATFCTCEIPSWGLFRRSAGGGIYHGGLLHQHHSLSDDVWVVYFRPTGP